MNSPFPAAFPAGTVFCVSSSIAAVSRLLQVLGPKDGPQSLDAALWWARVPADPVEPGTMPRYHFRPERGPWNEQGQRALDDWHVQWDGDASFYPRIEINDRRMDLMEAARLACGREDEDAGIHAPAAATYAQIGEALGVTRQAVHLSLRRLEVLGYWLAPAYPPAQRAAAAEDTAYLEWDRAMAAARPFDEKLHRCCGCHLWQKRSAFWSDEAGPEARPFSYCHSCAVLRQNATRERMLAEQERAGEATPVKVATSYYQRRTGGWARRGHLRASTA